ncbi:fibronectin type III domain-containing protein, partial [Foetidibacter luteolus]|uniref:fibronectin type III domain-containing protein n=1 Tax=Foetidibacter luteolus TaxID=2608880 RepID=UPI00129A95A2
MKTQNGLLKLFMIAVAALTMQFTLAQTGVLDPNDPIVVYNPGSPPATPPYGTLAKWVKTNRLSWNTSTFKCYFYNGVAFRLRFPKSYQHGVNDGKKYPVYLFFHGRGEKGTIYDNEYQLYHGGQSHMNAVVADKFDGFLLYPQNQTDGWGAGLTVMSEFIQNYLVPQCKADRFRIIVDGLSAGGAATWKFLVANYKVPAAVLPISNTDLAYLDAVQQFKFTPMWQFQGGLDKAPSPGYTQQLANGILNVGGNYKLTVYPTLGHGCWNQAWAETDYYPFLNRAYKSNPWVLFGRSEFCPGDNINVTIGVTPGFNAYEWRKDGNLISGATGNQVTVTSVGVYSCRMRDGATLWSDWSPIPMEIKYKTSANIPSITVAGLASKVIPSLDGSTGVTLQVPEGYATYSWQKEPSSTVLSTTNTVNAAAPGDYKVKAIEQFGCSSDFSAPFTVIDANGPNKPEAPINLSATTLSKTAIKLDWSDNPQPQYNETGFEIYEARSSDGPYSLVSITGADVLTYTRTDLNANTRYYYKLRAVNETAASAASNVANT